MKSYLYNNEPYVIAETAYSFEGDASYLLKQTEELTTDINAVKYHMMMNVDEYMDASHPVFKPLQNWLLSKNDWKNILSQAKSQNFDTVVLADDRDSVSFCKEHYDLVDAIEIHAACVNDIALLDEAILFAKDYDKVFILGISGFEIQELLDIVEYVEKYELNHVLLMYGFQNFPTDINLINLEKIQLLEELLGHAVGYADHTEYTSSVKELLIARGANIQEVHYVLEEGVKRTDYITAVGSERLSVIKRNLDTLHLALGSVDVRLNKGEKEYLNARKVPVYAMDIEKGDVLTQDKVAFKRIEYPSKQNKFNEVASLYGNIMAKDVSKGDEVYKSDTDSKEIE